MLYFHNISGADREQRYRRSKMHAIYKKMVLRDVQEREGCEIRRYGE